MLRRVFLALGAVAIFFTASLAANAQTVRDAQTTAIRLTIAETVLATNSQLSDRAGPPVKELSWYADLNERSWSLTIRGFAQKGPIQIWLTGFLWGDEAGDWIVAYSGAGESAGEPIQINGKLDWPFDKTSSDRLKADFSQVTKFGKNSTWGWIHGTETIVGGAVGGAAGAAVSSISPFTIAIVGLAGAIGGAASAITLSDTIRIYVDADKPPPPPAPPPAPSIGKGEAVTLKDGMLYVAVTKEGDVRGRGPDAKYVLEGATKDTSMSGRVTQQ